MGQGSRQCRPASITVEWYRPNWVMTAFCPSCTMKKPVPSHTSAAAPASRARPAPALPGETGEEGEERPRRPGGGLPPKRPPSLRLKSFHSSSRSGGCWPPPDECGRGSSGGCGRWGSCGWPPSAPSGGGLALDSSGRSSWPRPQRGSFRLSVAAGRRPGRRPERRPKREENRLDVMRLAKTGDRWACKRKGNGADCAQAFQMQIQTQAGLAAAAPSGRAAWPIRTKPRATRAGPRRCGR